VVQYETVLKADSFLVMAHGTADEMTRAHALLAQANATSVEIHRQALTAVPAAA
jgi:hypothetical protein